MTAAKGLVVEDRTRRYKVLLPLTVSTSEGSWTQGETFDHVFTAEDEWTNVDSGLLELQPETYKVIGDSPIEINLVEAPASRQTKVAQPGETFEAAIPLAREEQLRMHIRRVTPPATAKPVKSEQSEQTTRKRQPKE